jgi:hypothetical protein
MTTVDLRAEYEAGLAAHKARLAQERKDAASWARPHADNEFVARLRAPDRGEALRRVYPSIPRFPDLMDELVAINRGTRLERDARELRALMTGAGMGYQCCRCPGTLARLELVRVKTTGGLEGLVHWGCVVTGDELA